MDGNGKQGQEGPSPEEKTELQIEKADPSGLEEIRMFYHSLIDEMHRRGLPVTWKKDIYPNTAFLKQAIEEGTLYTGRSAGRLVSVMVLNHRHSPEYEQGAWQERLGDSQGMVLHALGVHPDAAGEGSAEKWWLKLSGLPGQKGPERCGWMCSGAMNRPESFTSPAALLSARALRCFTRIPGSRCLT